MISTSRLVILYLASNLFRSAFCGITPLKAAYHAKDQGSTANSDPAISKEDAAQPLPLLGGHKTPLHRLISRKKRYYKQKEERKKILTQPNMSVEKQAVVAQIEHEKAVKRNANHKRYRRLQFSVLTNSATPAEQRTWDIKLRTKAYRNSDPILEERYQKELQSKRDKNKVKKDEKLKLTQNQETSQTTLLRKRGEPKSFDLNVQLDEHEGEEVQSQPSQESSLQQAQEALKPDLNRSRGKKYIPVSELSEEKREAMNAKERARYKQRKELWKEALLDPSKMTPEIKKRMEASKRSNKAATRKYVTKLKSLSSQGLATEKQKMTIGIYDRNKRWREASPTNMKKYKDKNKKDYIRKITKKHEKQDKQETNSNH